MSPRRAVSSNAAFTLIELSLVLVVMGLLSGTIIQLVTQNARRAAQTEVQRKMDVIEAKLLYFSQANGRMPCPGDSTQLTTSQYFGVEGGIPGTLFGCGLNFSYYSPSHGSDLPSDGGTNATGTGSPVYAYPSFYALEFGGLGGVTGGDIPVKTLGLSDDYMFDPWGGRFFYAVIPAVAGSGSFAYYPVTTTSLANRILITDGSGLPKASNAIAVLMSYGPDGHGAFTLNGVRKATGNMNANTLTNCHCDSTAATTAAHPFGIFPPVTFVQAPATSTNSNDPTNFDDIVRYYTRSSFLNAADVTVPR